MGKNGTPPPVVTRFLQVCVATPDLNETCSQLVALGISPFKVWRFRPPVLFDRRFRGSDGDFAMDLAVAWAGNLQVEVVQPVAGSSLAAEFLALHGGAGLWHVMVGVKGSWKGTLASMAELFGEPAQSAAVAVPVKLGPVTIPAPPGKGLRSAAATRFVYFESAAALGTTLEIGKFPAGLSLRAASALGKPDQVIGRSGRSRSAITGFGLPVFDLAASQRAWSALVPNSSWARSPAVLEGNAQVLRMQLADVDLDLFDPSHETIWPGGYLRMRGGRNEPMTPTRGRSVSGIQVVPDSSVS